MIVAANTKRDKAGIQKNTINIPVLLARVISCSLGSLEHRKLIKTRSPKKNHKVETRNAPAEKHPTLGFSILSSKSVSVSNELLSIVYYAF